MTYREEGDVEDHKVECHTERDRTDEVHVGPNRKREKTLSLRE